jgi:serine/threonine-protein kinase
MGEVYRARDSALKRDVALKVLPADVASDRERLARFQREAEVLASLNHPRIAQIYGLERSGDTLALVMELVDGEDLAQRIARGPIALDEAIPLAIQVAEAIEAAHAEGVIHRDLKPANIKIRRDGTVKVLDFGLAKAMESSGPEAGLTATLTLNTPAQPRASAGTAVTQHGMILGTAAYMSPQQARGKAVDTRADIWAFGCVLFEMLAGKPAFDGETVTDIVAAVVHSDPPWALLPAATPPQVRSVLRRCLKKDPALRLHHIADARLELREAADDAASTPVAVLTSTRAGRRSTLIPWILAAASALGAFALAAREWQRPAARPLAVSRALIDFPQSSFSQARVGNLLALSPDGTRVVYVGNPDNQEQLYVRRLDQFEATPIAGTENASQPFFSPDSLSVGFFAAGKLKRVSLAGGTPITLADAPAPQGGAWSVDDTIVFGPNAHGLMRIPAGGGEAQRLTALSGGSVRHAWPAILPGGTHVLFTNVVAGADVSLDLTPMTAGEPAQLLDSACCASIAASGHLVYAHPVSGSIFAVPFDPQKRQLTGKPAQVLETTMAGPTAGRQFGLSDDGVLVYLDNSVAINARELVWVDRSGRTTPLGFEPRPYGPPTISPDGRRVTMSMYAGLLPREAWIGDLDRGTLARLAADGTVNSAPIWTRDGVRVTYASNVAGPQNLYSIAPDGTGRPERLTTGVDDQQIPLDWSPDGRTLLLWDRRSATGLDLFTMTLDGDRTPRVLVATPFNELAARFSPDGRHVAYISDRSGRFEVYVQPFPGLGVVAQVSANGGTEPVWAPSGREIFFREGDKMMVADVTTTPAFSVSRPRVLFEGRYEVSFLVPGARIYDVAADGQRFLMLKSSTSAASRQLGVVVKWFE